ncbi:MAG TPA: glycerol-3-phosphate 1-O-acyltransferase PlsY [Nevskiaceae bacterium]|nr:glycerol-3-phosphate 1-O-acyltransferase PlsY [Nevskiaceae bacterium]
MSELLAKVLLAYLLGNVMGGQIAGRLRGVDLRTQGSGNIGATNALRTQGKKFALLVLAIDVGKGVLAAAAIPLLPWPWGSAHVPRESLEYACGAAAAIGHCYPALHGFRGGKGVATLAGVYATVMTAALPWILLAFIAIVILTGYVSLATLTAAIVALLHVACFDAHGIFSALGAFCVTMTLLVLWKHRANWGRLLRGTEHRFDRARLLHRWLRR